MRRPLCRSIFPGMGHCICPTSHLLCREGLVTSSKNGFVKIRRGIDEHLLSGRLGYFDLGIYITIHLQADYRTGIWIGSAPRLVASSPRNCTLRQVKNSLHFLEQGRYIRRFLVHGKRGNYRVLIDKYEPQTGDLTGMRLNAWESNTWQSPKYEYVPEAVPEAVPLSRSRSTNENEKEDSKPLARELHGFELFWTAYPKKIGKPQARRAWLSKVRTDDSWPEVLKGLELWKATVKWMSEPEFIPYPATFLNGMRWQDSPMENNSIPISKGQKQHDSNVAAIAEGLRRRAGNLSLAGSIQPKLPA